MFLACQVSFNPHGILGGGLCAVTCISQMRKPEIKEVKKGTQALECAAMELRSEPMPSTSSHTTAAL